MTPHIIQFYPLMETGLGTMWLGWGGMEKNSLSCYSLHSSRRTERKCDWPKMHTYDVHDVQYRLRTKKIGTQQFTPYSASGVIMLLCPREESQLRTIAFSVLTCLFVGSHVSNYVFRLHEIFCTCYLWSWLSHQVITFRVWVVDDAKCILVTSRASVCLCLCPRPHAHTTAGTRM